MKRSSLAHVARRVTYDFCILIACKDATFPLEVRMGWRRGLHEPAIASGI